MSRAELIADDAGCITLKDGTVPVWPKGYTVTGDAKSFTVLDAAGQKVAESGVQFKMGGGAVPTFDAAWTNSECAAASTQIWWVG